MLIERNLEETTVGNISETYLIMEHFFFFHRNVIKNLLELVVFQYLVK